MTQGEAKATVEEFLQGNPTLKELIARYPSDWVRSDSELRLLLASGGVPAVLEAAKNSGRALERIVQSGYNPQVHSEFFPWMVRARMMTLALKNYSLAAQTKSTGKVQFTQWNAGVLQRLFFADSRFRRKPVEPLHYRLVWPFVTQKKILMPLVSKKGIYCFFGKPLIAGLVRLIAGRSCVEVAAGDGTLSRFLSDAGCQVRATDNQSWKAFIEYPPEVEALDARQALEKYRPEVVVSCWPDPANPWEASVFAAPATQVYIVLGSRTPGATGNAAVYEAATGFERQAHPRLARWLLPRSLSGEVLVFTRKALPSA